MINLLPHPSSLLILLHLVVVVGFSLRVIMQRPATGVALAWLFFIAAIPLAGCISYLLIGEKRIPPERKQRLARLRESYASLVEVLSKEKPSAVDWSRHSQRAREMDRMGRYLVGLPTVSGSTGRMFSETELSLQGIADDVDAAAYSVLMEFYIYRKGLLHTKSITADRRISMFGTVNLDMRSLWINYEVAAFVYGGEFGEQLQKLQQSYIDDSDLLIAEEWARSSDWQRFLENTFRLTSPVL
ncbi:MAG: phospholipase D-like domain-containing protein [Verrucomicrobiales bacterium]|nr:phospholipase D-like domain-containing protein [Verrucomicrobiales bacterium]